MHSSTRTTNIKTTTDPVTGVTTQVQETSTPHSRSVRTITTSVDKITGVTTQVQEEVIETTEPEPKPPKPHPNRATRR